MRTDALHDLIRDVGDDSSPEHKAIYHLWTGLDDLERSRILPSREQRIIALAYEKAAAAITSSRTGGPTDV